MRSEATLTRSTTTEELHSAEASLSETKTTLEADEKYLEELKQSCTTKATEWAARQKQAGEETAAIEKAKEVPLSTPPAPRSKMCFYISEHACYIRQYTDYI